MSKQRMWVGGTKEIRVKDHVVKSTKVDTSKILRRTKSKYIPMDPQKLERILQKSTDDDNVENDGITATFVNGRVIVTN